MKKVTTAILLVLTFYSVAAIARTSPGRDRLAEDVAKAIATSKCSAVTNMSIPYKNIAEIAARNQNTYLAAARLVMEDTYYRGVINKRANEIVTNINSGKVSCHALALWAVSAMNMPLKQ